MFNIINVFNNLVAILYFYVTYIVYILIIIAFSFISIQTINKYKLSSDRFEYCYLDQQQKNNSNKSIINTLNKKNNFLSKRNYLYVKHTKTINDIKQTLEISFGINKYESKYYSYFYNDMQELYSISWELLSAVDYINGDFLLPYNIYEEECNLLNINYKEYIESSMLRLVVNTNYLIKCIKKNNLDINNGIVFYKLSIDPEIDSILAINYLNEVIKEYKRTEAIYNGVRLRSSGLFIPLYPYDFNNNNNKSIIKKEHRFQNISN